MTALMQTTAKAATHAAQKPPLEVSNTSQLRDLAQSAVRIFGWDRSFPRRLPHQDITGDSPRRPHPLQPLESPEPVKIISRPVSGAGMALRALF